MMYEEIKKSFRTLLLHRLRSALSTLGILFGVVAVIAMLSIGEGAKQETLEQIKQLGTNSIIIRQHATPKEKETGALVKKPHELVWQDAETLRTQIPELQSVAALKVVDDSSLISSKTICPEILAVNRTFGDMMQLQLLEGRFLCDLDQKEHKLVCVLGYELATHLGQEGHVGQAIQLGNRQYEIVGVLRPSQWKESKNQSINARNQNLALFIPLTVDDQMNGKKSSQGNLSEIILQVRDVKTLESTVKLSKIILNHLHEGVDNYQIIIPQELLKQAGRTQQTFNLVLGSIAAISLIVGGIGIMNIMLANVSERTREIGIRRALGASKRHILIQFLLETLVLSFIGALLGIIIGIGLSSIITTVAGWRTIVTPWSIALALIMSTAVGLCSGLYPAYHAANMDPIQALRHNQ